MNTIALLICLAGLSLPADLPPPLVCHPKRQAVRVPSTKGDYWGCWRQGRNTGDRTRSAGPGNWEPKPNRRSR